MKKHLIIAAAMTFAVMLTAFSSCKKTEDDDNTPAKEGLYLGIVGFNSDFYTIPLNLLNQNTKASFESFVDGLTMQNGTYLYHAVNTGLDNLCDAKIPENLINVSIVTFTDGLDQGSYVLGGYSSGSEYLNEVNRRIRNELVGGQSISAYSIGVRGSDINENDIEGFRNSLKKLSSDPDHNVFEVNSMNEASEKFAEIAQQLYNQSTFYSVTLKMSPQEPNTRIRFTFDDVDVSESQCYIEGTYIRTSNNKGQLVDVNFVGMESISGDTITATFDGKYDLFAFQNLTDLGGNQMTTSYVKLWHWEESSAHWSPNSEFTSSDNTEIVDEYKSAMIMLVLDCSKSLGDDFVNMKTAANGFIETLSGNYNGRK